MHEYFLANKGRSIGLLVFLDTFLIQTFGEEHNLLRLFKKTITEHPILVPLTCACYIFKKCITYATLLWNKIAYFSLQKKITPFVRVDLWYLDVQQIAHNWDNYYDIYAYIYDLYYGRMFSFFIIWNQYSGTPLSWPPFGLG